MSVTKVAIGSGAILLSLVLAAGQFTTISTGENGLYIGFDG
jgi:hypothetical protein